MSKEQTNGEDHEWKWKYNELKRRYKRLENKLLDLAGRHDESVRHLADLQDQREVLIGKYTEIRVRRRKMISKIPRNALGVFKQDRRAAMRKKYPLASRAHLGFLMEKEWRELSSEQRENWKTEFEKTSQQLNASSSQFAGNNKSKRQKRGKTKGRVEISSRDSHDSSASQPPFLLTHRCTTVSGKEEKKALREVVSRDTKNTERSSTRPSKKARKVLGRASHRHEESAEPAHEDEDDVDEEGFQSSGPESEEDSDDTMVHLPTGAFG